MLDKGESLIAQSELIGTGGRLSEQHVDLLLDPLLVVRRIGVGGLLVDQAADVLHLEQVKSYDRLDIIFSKLHIYIYI